MLFRSNKLNIAIIGLGNIGSYLFSYLNKNKKILSKKNNCVPNVLFVSAKNKKRKRKIKIKKKLWLKNYLDATKDKNVDLIIELIGGSEGAAKKLVFNALKNKKHVVTANKAVIYHHGDEILKLAKENGVRVLFESAVCAGTPIIKLLKEELAANRVSKISGMLNGTSNFILSNMEEGAEFDSTLELAQKEGYAEPDPTFDIEGMDAAHKIGILSALEIGRAHV